MPPCQQARRVEPLRWQRYKLGHGEPERVMTTDSPVSTRSITSPPWLRRSRMVTSLMTKLDDA